MEIKLVPIKDIKTDTRLQPRNIDLVTGKHRGPEEKRTENHIYNLFELLQGSKQKQLTPIVLTTINEALIVIDGHHRLEAYKKAKRNEIPATILNLDLKQSYLRARTANAEERALPMHREQSNEAAWQIVLDLTNGGANDLPKPNSIRTIANSVNASKSTVGKMIPKAQQWNGKWKLDFSEAACDEMTGYPYWKYARGDWWRDGKFAVDDDAKRLAEIAHIKSKLGSLLNQFDQRSFMAALEELAEEEQIERDEIPEEFAPEF